jgi:hypothetical protein
MIQSTMSFQMSGYIDTPANIREDFIQRIYMRLGMVDADSTIGADILADLDSQGIDYDLVQDGTDALAPKK